MRRMHWTSAILLPFVLGALLTNASAQGKGYGKEQKAAKSQGQQGAAAKQNKSNKSEKAARATRAAVVREAGASVERKDFRAFAASKKHGQRLAGLAIARANRGGLSDDELVITPVGNRVHVLNRSGVLLLDLDDDRDVGTWKVVGEPDRKKKDGPSFCRSGAGHPVWGRQWCVDKGFGLGNDGDVRWGRIIDPNVVLRRRVDTDRLDRAVLLDVLGDVVFNRLAAHAITLGLVEPLAGRWLGEPSGPRVLLLTSGDRPVAEIVDVDRDNRAEMLVVSLRPR